MATFVGALNPDTQNFVDALENNMTDFVSTMSNMPAPQPPGQALTALTSLSLEFDLSDPDMPYLC
eukprot:2998292-Rhodomonas_salina.1